MEKISVDKSLDLYLNTLSYLDEKYINASDADLEYYILEELDADAHTFLHSYTVNLLIENNLIPGSVAVDTDTLRTLLKELIDKKRKLDQIRLDNDWKKARQLAKHILIKIKSHHDANSI